MVRKIKRLDLTQKPITRLTPNCEIYFQCSADFPECNCAILLARKLPCDFEVARKFTRQVVSSIDG
ncbi:MAG: hypothetical protein DME26_18565 [Verrucomicrobia bacterium]|nr:MAG: hypothetical protein DME26_18565 [Verrucomicrobiota bacterium]